jgi:putative colanic acid biosynthesis acetyltransferase WcaF
LTGTIRLEVDHEELVTSSGTVNVAANRAAHKWTRGELVRRTLWEVLRIPLFALTPRPLWAWRRAVLRAFGAKVGRSVRIHPSVKIAVPWTLSIGAEAGIGDGAILYGLGPITIGPRTTISQYAHLCAGSHDHCSADFRLTKPPIAVGADAWICADAFIGPGVTVGDRAIVGARAVVMKDVPEGVIVAGNPARVVRNRSA